MRTLLHHHIKRKYHEKATQSLLQSMILVLAAASAPAMASPNISIQFTQPGGYGRVDIGNTTMNPDYLYGGSPVYGGSDGQSGYTPIYMNVSPKQRSNWRRHCAEYRACGAPVYFVTDSYVHEFHSRPDHHRPRNDDRHHEHKNEHGHGHGHGHDDDRGRGHGNGHGHHGGNGHRR